MGAARTRWRETGARGTATIIAAAWVMVLASCTGSGLPGGLAPAAPPGAATRQVPLAPVDQRGQVASGWSVDESGDDPGSPIDCGDTSRAYPSPAGVSGDIYYCSPSAAGADACWPTPRPRRMLCLRDPFTTTLSALTATALVARVPAASSPVPLGLRLADGDRCRLRDGGAWSSPESHPDYVGSYSCDRGGIVWAAPGTAAGGINRTARRWTVLRGEVTGPLAVVPITEAYVVATAP
ncbi:hypothetical protein [Frankia sp. AgKG'84/4]|uniref:hypothetical protein n=1 Tax=Frankia sp. AgKG'84/4 TaxID=573490 RepID=UPI00200E720A|nr:hypothetical protein [Frankia sp. AgKG'84/4]MCL9795663.1 hypothetical protein [Frankia sp. AgKG'84/4]